MKKVLLLVLFILITTGCVGEKEELISKDSELIGIWTMIDSKQNENDDSIVEKLSFQFNEDGSCVYTYRLLTGTQKNIPLEGKTEGNCYLNKSNKKFILKSENQNILFNEWNSYKLDSSTLIIGNYTFSKEN